MICEATIVQVLQDYLLVAYNNTSGLVNKPLRESFEEGNIVYVKIEKIKGVDCLVGIWRNYEKI